MMERDTHVLVSQGIFPQTTRRLDGQILRFAQDDGSELNGWTILVS